MTNDSQAGGGLLRQLMSREHTPLVQFLKYAVAGGIATTVHIVVFFLCAWFLLPALTANDPIPRLLGLTPGAVAEGLRARHAAIDNVLAFLFSNLTAYLVNILWVFESGRHRRWVEFLMFTGVSGTSMLLGTSLQSYLIHTYGIATSIAFGSNVLTALLINYGMRKFVIFKG